MSWKLHSQPEIDRVVAIVKHAGIVESVDDLESIVVLQGQENNFERLQGIVKFGLAPYFDAFCLGSNNQHDLEDNLSATRRKITELELALRTLQQGSEIPGVFLTIHPAVERSLNKDENTMSDEELVTDHKLVNELQTSVVRWTHAVQKVTMLERNILSGTAEQEIKFWPSMEYALKGIELQLQSDGVRKTMELLKLAKRYQAVIAFETDTGLKSAIDRVAKYNLLIRDFPLTDILGAQSLSELSSGIGALFSHVTKRFRNTTYPIERCTSLIGLVSGDVQTSMVKILKSEQLMHLKHSEFELLMDQVRQMLRTWDEGAREYTRVARELKIKRGDTHGTVTIKSQHAKLAERLQYVLQLREGHEKFRESLVVVFQGEPDGAASIDELDNAYECLRPVDILDTTEEGTKSLALAERVYSSRIGALEKAVITLMQQQLYESENSRDMFRIFSKFNVLFLRSNIRGAVIEHQNKLLDMVKREIHELQRKYRRPYTGSSYEALSHSRDVTDIAGSIQWARQFELRLDNFLARVQAVLGPDWQEFAEGRKVLEEANLFRAKLNVESMAKEWAVKVNSANLQVSGIILRAVKRGRGYLQVESTFDPRLLELHRSARQMSSMGFDVPRKAWSLSSAVKNCVGLVNSIDESLRSLDQIHNNEVPAMYIGLLNSAFNEVYQVIQSGFALDWQSFAYADDKSVSFALSLDKSVTTMRHLMNNLEAYQSQIEEFLTLLATCDKHVLRFHIDSLQQIVDRLGSYSNVEDFVHELNKQVFDCLVQRCKQDLISWTSFKDVQPRHHQLRIQKTIGVEPPLNQSRAYWLAILQSLATSYRSLPTVGIHQRQTFEAFPFEQSVSTELCNAYEVIDTKFAAASTYVNEWYQFQSLWDLEPDFVVKHLGESLPSWIEVLRDIQRSRALLDREEVQHFSLVRIDCTPLYHQMELKYDNWQSELIRQFADKWVSKLDELCSDFSQKRIHLESCEFQNSSVAALVELLTVVKECEDGMDSWETQIVQCREGQAVLKAYRLNVSSSWTQIEQLESEWSALKEIVQLRRRKIEEQRSIATIQISGEVDRLSSNLRRTRDVWQQRRPQGGQDPQTALGELHDFKLQTLDLKNTYELLQRATSLLNMEPTELPVMELLDEVEDYISVWTAIQSVWDKIEECRLLAWADVVPRKLRQILDDCIVMIKSMAPKIRQYSAVKQTQATIDSLIQSNAILSELNKEFIKERHWKRLFSSCNRPFVRQRLLKLGHVWDLGLAINAAHIKQVIEVAKGEFVLEEFLGQVKDVWSNFTVELIDFKSTSLIKNWDDLFQKCDEHSSALLGMHQSPYFREFEDECLSWESKLDRIKRLFDVWIEVQRQWVYLEALFDEENGEIRRILPQESAAFLNVSHTLLGIQRAVAKRFFVVEIINMPDIQDTMERLHDGLCRVQKALGDYIEQERQKFARLYFVGDEDLLEMIGNGGDIAHMQKHLSKMFAGINALRFDGTQISAVISKEGEVMELQNIVDASGKAVEWLSQLQQEVSSTLAQEVRMMVHELRHDFKSWLDAPQTCQAKSLALETVWTEQVEQSFDDLSGLIERYNEMLAVLAERVLKPANDIERRTSEILITELVHLRDTLKDLLTERANTSTFSWQRRLKYRLVGGLLKVEQANAVFDYGYEYNGLPDRLVATKLVDDCFLTMTQALKHKLGGSPFGPAGTGKTETIKALGQKMGKLVVVFCCDEQFDYQALGRILAGLCEIGAWGCFDEFNRLDAKILSAVASQVEAVETGIGTTVDLAGRQVRVDASTGLFITMNPGYAGRNALPQNLRRLFRSFSMARPDKETIAEVILFSQGFQTAPNLSKKVVPVFESFQRQFTQQTHYDFGLRALKSVLKMSGILKRSNLNEEEHIVLMKAIWETVVPKLVDEDLKTMKE